MTSLTIHINTDNDAFQEGRALGELSRLLIMASDKYEREDEGTYPLLDVNGNTCGSLVIEDGPTVDVVARQTASEELLKALEEIVSTRPFVDDCDVPQANCSPSTFEPLAGTLTEGEGDGWTHWRFWPRRLSDDEVQAINCCDAGNGVPGAVFHHEPYVRRSESMTLWTQSGGLDV